MITFASQDKDFNWFVQAACHYSISFGNNMIIKQMVQRFAKNFGYEWTRKKYNNHLAWRLSCDHWKIDALITYAESREDVVFFRDIYKELFYNQKNMTIRPIFGQKYLQINTDQFLAELAKKISMKKIELIKAISDSHDDNNFLNPRNYLNILFETKKDEINEVLAKYFFLGIIGFNLRQGRDKTRSWMKWSQLGIDDNKFVGSKPSG